MTVRATCHDIAWFRETLSDEARRRSWYDSVISKNAELRAFESVAGYEELPPASTASSATTGAALAGVPFGVKDLFAVDGYPTSAGSSLPPELFDNPESTAVRRLRDAGAVVLGKTKTDEFAYAAPPDTLNPLEHNHTPGGSSAGSAAAVASGMCPFALGTQTSRSIIAPASFCGIVGFKASHGRIPIDGVVPLSPSMDDVGILASTVSDIGTLAPHLIDDWRGVEETAARGVVGVPTPSLRKQLLEGLSAFPVYERFIEERFIEERSFKTVRFRWEEHVATVFQNAMDLLHGEMAEVHRDWFARYHELYQEITRKGVLRGQAIDEERLQEVRDWAVSFRTELEEDLREAGVDVLLVPSQPQEAPLLNKGTGFGHTTTPWSAAGLPCLSIPALTVHALPVGLQGVAPFGKDEELVSTMQRPEFLDGA